MSHQHRFLASDALGTPVTATGGEEVGTVADLVIDSGTGGPRYVVVKLHDQDDVLVVPWQASNVRDMDGGFRLYVPADALRTASRVDAQHYRSRLAESGWDRDLHPADQTALPKPDVSYAAPAGRAASHGPSAAPIVLIALLVVAVAALGYLVSRQGWAATSEQMQTVATSVRDTSANAATTAKVKAALALSKRVSAFRIDVDSNDHLITLSGNVPTEAVRDLAEDIALDTSGVLEVRNALTVDPSVRPDPDQARLVDRIETLELQLQIAEAIHMAPDLEGAQVRVELVADVVSLEGRVVTAAQRARAEQIARTFEGVRRVDNGLVVADRPGGPAAEGRPS